MEQHEMSPMADKGGKVVVEEAANGSQNPYSKISSEQTQVKVEYPFTFTFSTRNYFLTRNVESLQFYPDLLLLPYVPVKLGNYGAVGFPLRISSYIFQDINQRDRNLNAVLTNGGPQALIWGVLIVIAGAMAQSASLAEMASMQPIAGAQYHWTHYLAPPNQKRFITWMQGNTFSYVVSCPSQMLTLWLRKQVGSLGSLGSLFLQV
jgi:hypothetical protein